MDVPNTAPSYAPVGKRGRPPRRDTIYIVTTPGEGRPVPKPVPEKDRSWRPREFAF